MRTLFTLNEKAASKLRDAELVQKTKQKTATVKKKSSAILDIINQIRENVEAKFAENNKKYYCITTVDELNRYIDIANKNTIIAIDTETTGLDLYDIDIVGFSIYTPGERAAYIPINHIDYITGERFENQLTREEVRQCLERLTARVVMFNANFDVRVIKRYIGITLCCYWDTYIAAKLLDENRKNNKLKQLHQHYVLRDQEEESQFSELFEGLIFSKVPIDLAYAYAAHDAIITFELYEFQARYLHPNSRPDLVELYNVLMNIEMPVLAVVIEMEDTGIQLDMDYTTNYLYNKYHKIQDEMLQNVYKTLEQYNPIIEKYKATHPKHGLDNPINLDSSTQLGTLLYDILGAPSSINPKKDRSCDAETLEKLAAISKDDKKKDKLNYDLSFLVYLLEYRKAFKNTSTYIDKMPSIIKDDGRIHCRFNQTGTVTGRFSSDEPNLQNIPARNDEIRKMFIATRYERNIEEINNCYIVDDIDEVELVNNQWKFAAKLQPGDQLIDDNQIKTVKSIVFNNHKINIYVN